MALASTAVNERLRSEKGRASKLFSVARQFVSQICRVEALESRQLLSTTWFVSPSGNGNNPGTLAAPLQTIQEAAKVAQTGDKVEIETGTYHETVTPAHSGVTFEAYNSEN